MSKKAPLFHLTILFFVYVNLFSGTLSLLGITKDKTKVEKEIPIRHARLEIPAKVNRYGKKQKEAFMALATYPLGFVNTDTRQAPFIEKFLIKYHEYKTDYEISYGRIEKLFKENDPWCRDLLQEPVLQDNKILYEPRYTKDFTKQLKKIVHFDYFSKEDEYHEVIECPIYIHNREVMMYFSTLGVSPREKLTYYFVLTPYTLHDNSKLTILMRTKWHKQIDVRDKNDIYNDYMFDYSTVGKLRLNIKPKRFKDDYRLFGKYAEAAFISTNYGFWNPTIKRIFLYNFLEMIFALSKGYEVERRKLKSKAVLKAGPDICESHINNSRLFRTYDIKYDAEYAAQITTTKQNVGSFIQNVPDQRFRFLTCPVTKGSANDVILHHPIYFKSSAKFSRYDLFWYIASHEDYKGEEVLLLLAPNDRKLTNTPGNQEITEHF